MSLKLVQRPGRPYWYMHGTVRGITVRESTGTDNRAKAEEIKIRRETELLDRSIHGAKATATWIEASVLYGDKGGERAFLDKIDAKLGSTRLDKIDAALINNLRRSLYPHLKPNSVNRVLYTPIISVLRCAAKAGMCDTPSIERPEYDDKRIRSLTREEAERLLDACAPHLRSLVLFLFGTGARLSEALYLDWRNVDLERGQVSFVHDPAQGFTVKNKKSRGVPLPDRVIAELKTMPHREGAVFRTQLGKPYAPKPSSRSNGSQIKAGFHAACRRAGIENFRPHDCRHTWATWFYKATPDLQKLMLLGGWSSLDMVLRYAHVDVSQHAAAVDAAFAGWGEKAAPRLRVVGA